MDISGFVNKAKRFGFFTKNTECKLCNRGNGLANIITRLDKCIKDSV